MKLFLIGTLFLFLSCNGQKKTAMQTESESNTTGLQLLVTDSHSGAEESETLIVTDAKTLQAFYSKINMTRKPGLPIPEVNFKKEMIVITCSGEIQDGSLPTLKILKETDAQMVFSTALKLDKKNNSKAITSPFSIYKMPLTDKEIIFEKENQ